MALGMAGSIHTARGAYAPVTNDASTTVADTTAKTRRCGTTSRPSPKTSAATDRENRAKHEYQCELINCRVRKLSINVTENKRVDGSIRDATNNYQAEEHGDDEKPRLHRVPDE
jgi:hypothetical protein